MSAITKWGIWLEGEGWLHWDPLQRETVYDLTKRLSQMPKGAEVREYIGARKAGVAPS
jgi:hypothetical protein